MDDERNQRLSDYEGFDVPRPASTPEHTAERPSWECRACGKDWPCNPARGQLLAEAAQDGAGGTSWVAMLMWGFLEDYSLDVGPGPLDEAYQRFLAWTRP